MNSVMNFVVQNPVITTGALLPFIREGIISLLSNYKGTATGARLFKATYCLAQSLMGVGAIGFIHWIYDCNAAQSFDEKELPKYVPISILLSLGLKAATEP